MAKYGLMKKGKDLIRVHLHISTTYTYRSRTVWVPTLLLGSSERNNMNTKAKAIALSYFRAGVAAAIAVYLAGNTSPKALLTAALAAIAGPALKALDPSSPEFGVGSK